MLRIIYAIYVNSGPVGACLDAIRLFASPTAKRFSHLTVRGPYDFPLDEDYLSFLNLKIKSNNLLIRGVGNFFQSGQNTVFFTCEGESLREVWDKPDFKKFTPHVTVYDGKDAQFALSLFNIMEKYRYRVQCGGDKLQRFEIGNGKNGELANEICTADLPEELELGSEFANQVNNMPIDERLASIDKICKYLQSIRQ